MMSALVVFGSSDYSATGYHLGSPERIYVFRVKSPFAGSVKRSAAVPSNAWSTLNALLDSTKSLVMYESVAVIIVRMFNSSIAINVQS